MRIPVRKNMEECFAVFRDEEAFCEYENGDIITGPDMISNYSAPAMWSLIQSNETVRRGFAESFYPSTELVFMVPSAYLDMIYSMIYSWKAAHELARELDRS